MNWKALSTAALATVATFIYIVSEWLNAPPGDAAVTGVVVVLGVLAGIAILVTTVLLSSKSARAPEDNAQRHATAAGVVGVSVAVAATFFQPWGPLAVASLAAGGMLAFLVYVLIRARAVKGPGRERGAS